MANHGADNDVENQCHGISSNRSSPENPPTIQNPGSSNNRMADCETESDESSPDKTRVKYPLDKFLKKAKKEGFLPDNTSGIKYKKPTDSLVDQFRILFRMLWINPSAVPLYWLVINLSVPSLKRVTFLGSLLWKWSLLAFVSAVPFSTFQLFKISAYQLSSCLEISVAQLVYSIPILLTWLLCVRTHYNLLHRYGTLTLSSLLVGAVLSVFKSWTMLQWMKKFIYKNNKGKILVAAFQLFFLLQIIDEKPISKKLLVKWQKLMNNSSGQQEVMAFLNRKNFTKVFGFVRHVEWLLISRLSLIPRGILRQEGQVVDVPEKPDDQDGEVVSPVEKYMLSKIMRSDDIENVASRLTESLEFTLKEGKDVPDIVPKMQHKFQCDKSDPITQQVLEDKLSLDPTYAKLLLDVLQKDLSKEDHVSYEEFEIWMDGGLKGCFRHGERLNGALEMMQILDRVLNGFIVVVVILIWLVITGLTTTKVVVGLASFFLGLTFIFGDTCKTFFQGVIFSFVIHPFDIGDRCIIDNNMLKVIKMNIMTTTFSQNRKEVVKYPNSILTFKEITVLSAEPADPENVIELNLHSSITTSQILSLQERIEECIKDGIKSGRYKRPYGVLVKDNGDCIRVSVHYEHNLDNEDVKDQVESLQFRKNKQRSQFLLQIRQFLEDVSAN